MLFPTGFSARRFTGRMAGLITKGVRSYSLASGQLTQPEQWLGRSLARIGGISDTLGLPAKNRYDLSPA